MSNKKKKRNKAHNPIKPQVRLTSWESNRVGKRYITAEFRKGFAWTELNKPKDYEEYVVKPRNWALTVRALLWYPDGKVDIKSETRTERNITLIKLEAEAKKMRADILEKSKREHIVDVGWHAMTFNIGEPDTYKMDEVDLGAITEERQMLWNLAWREEVKSIVESDERKVA